MVKKKIVAICDHVLSVSGVGTQARFLIDGLAQTGDYTFRVLGAGLKHEDYRQQELHPDIIVKPIDGFGNTDMIRQVLVTERPDALLLFTDPRFFQHIWNMEDEIHQVCPIAYNTIWDNGDITPDYNRYVYESCDLLHCINWPTYEFVSEWRPGVTHYTPHAVPKDIYKPLSDDQRRMLKTKFLGVERKDHFTVLFCGRNAKRKRPSDVLWAFRMFLDELKKKHGHTDATIVMHCNPLDHEGPNLYQVINKLDLKDNIVISQNALDFTDMVSLYNVCDTLVNISFAEGFGLPVLEMKMCGRPVIAIKTGGLTRQVEDHLTGQPLGIPLPVELQTTSGHQLVPYICDDYCTVRSVADAYMKMYEMGPERRDELGRAAMAHAHRDYDLNAVVRSWDVTLKEMMANWRSRRKSWHVATL